MTEEKLKNSLAEKETLLREIHHRVKNNMQIISSLLSMETQYVKEEETVNVLKESQNRIRSMAMVHEKLYQSQDLTNINIRDYILSLVSDLFYSYHIQKDQITLVTDVDDIKLNLETAMPCGLIICELVSNSLKYAFPEKQKGKVEIILKLIGETMHLTISDNGIGLPSKDYLNEETLGLQLVQNLTNQLDGTIKLDLKQGTRFEIIFQESDYKTRT
jgi:two-component sensor histidine kinase